jgi:hypothetical protein
MAGIHIDVITALDQASAAASSPARKNEAKNVEIKENSRIARRLMADFHAAEIPWQVSPANRSKLAGAVGRR